MKDIKEKLTKNMEINKLYIIVPIVLIVVLVLFIIIMNLNKPSGKIIIKEVSHEIKGQQITIKYTVKNDKGKDYEMDAAFVDLLDKDGNVVGGYLLQINEKLKKGQTKEYTLTRDIVAPRPIEKLNFRYEEPKTEEELQKEAAK